MAGAKQKIITCVVGFLVSITSLSAAGDEDPTLGTTNVQLNNVMVPTKDLENSIAFFRDVLELPLQQSGPTFGWFKTGTTNLMLVLATDEHTPTDKGVQLEFVVESFQSLLDRLADRDISTRRWQGPAGGTYVSATEPGGNVINFVERGG